MSVLSEGMGANIVGVPTQLFETRYLRHDLADFLDLTEAIIFHTFFFGH